MESISEITLESLMCRQIEIQKQKEEVVNIWKGSPYEKLCTLQSNNVGIVGEQYIKSVCDMCNIEAIIDGSKTKKIGGGEGDGLILNKSVEIKTSHRGSKSASFQHELGESPWKSEYMIFIDIDPACIYLSIFKNFNEEFYKKSQKCLPYFPTKKITWRKKSGAFKLDTTVRINELNISKGITFKIDSHVSFVDLKAFILSNIE